VSVQISQQGEQGMYRSLEGRDWVGAFVTRQGPRGGGVGPLAGLSFGLKDLYDIAGEVTGFGSPAWAASHAPAERHAWVLERLLAAGADCVGKTHTDEFAYSLLGSNAHYGQPINVNAPGRLTGGSSSGSAAAVAAGLVDFAIGSDTGASVRVPAGLCGIYGIRTSHGRVPMSGALPLVPSFDTCGWFARDPALMLRVAEVLMPDPEPPLALTRAWYPADVASLLEPAVAAYMARATAELAEQLELPLETAPIASEDGGPAEWAEVFRQLQGHEAWSAHRAWIEAVQPAMGPDVGERFCFAASVTDATCQALLPVRERISAHLAGMLGNHTVLLLPASADVAPLRAATAEDLQGFRVRCMQLTSVSGMARLPQVVLPWGRLGGCPLGISMASARGTDRGLLARMLSLSSATTVAVPEMPAVGG